MAYCVMLSGAFCVLSCVCEFVCVSVYVIACFVCDSLCDVVWLGFLA